MFHRRQGLMASRKRQLAVTGGFVAVLTASVFINLPALATAGSGFSRSPLSLGLFGELDVKADKTGNWDLFLKTKDATDIGVDRLTVDPGGQSGWHKHAGPTFVTVTKGQLTWVDSNDCVVRTYHEGDGFVEPANHVHRARNATSTTIEFIAIQMRPQGSVGRIDTPAPTNCSA